MIESDSFSVKGIRENKGASPALARARARASAEVKSESPESEERPQHDEMSRASRGGVGVGMESAHPRAQGLWGAAPGREVGSGRAGAGAGVGAMMQETRAGTGQATDAQRLARSALRLSQSRAGLNRAHR